jgi:type IV secretory pathway TraG/TraD family ATPase VirD4
MSRRHVPMRVSAYLTLACADSPVEVDTWEAIDDTDEWYLRISSPGGELVIRADDPALIEEELHRWSVIVGTRWKTRDARGRWQSARRQAAAMVAASCATNPRDWWTSRATALLAALLYAARLEWKTEAQRRRAVVEQVLTQDAEQASEVLRSWAVTDPEAAHVRDVLDSVMRAGEQERSALWSTVADATDAYAFDEAVGS